MTFSLMQMRFECDLKLHGRPSAACRNGRKYMGNWSYNYNLLIRVATPCITGRGPTLYLVRIT